MGGPLSTESFLTRSLRRDAAGRDLAAIMAAAVAAVDPRRCVLDHLSRDGDRLRVGETSIPLPERGRILVAGAGKAGAAMTEALVELLGDRITDGLVVVKTIPEGADRLGPVRLRPALPVPDASSVAAATELLALVESAGPEDLVLCPISGGASSLLCAPAGDLSLEDLQTVTDALLRSGATIDEMNAVRKHLDRIKGGGLALAAAPARLLALVISDVPNDDLSTVASGPTVGDGTTFAEAKKILERLDSIPEAVTAWVLRGVAGELADNPRPGAPELSHVTTHCVASNGLAQAAAARAAEAAGYSVEMLPALDGEARVAGVDLGRRLATQPPGVVAIAGGETTVVVRGSGRGGRNQEVALAAVPVMLGLSNAIFATMGTDGEDGPTDAAGAVVRGNTLPRALERELDPMVLLDDNDAYRFFDELDDLIRTGPTGTNVCDLAFGLTEKA